MKVFNIFIFLLLFTLLLVPHVSAGEIGINGSLNVFNNFYTGGYGYLTNLFYYNSSHDIITNPYTLVDKEYVDNAVSGGVDTNLFVPYQNGTNDLNLINNQIFTHDIGINTTTPKVALDVNGYMNYYNYVVKIHRVADLTASSTNTWEDIPWGFINPDETVGNWFTLQDSNKEILVSDVNGVLRVQGCIHPYDDTANGFYDIVRVRFLVNGVEQRCLQASRGKDFRSYGMDILLFAGSIKVNKGDVLKVQWETSDTGIILHGDSAFDSPISASVNMNYISRSD